jgi:hypothetical protein
MKQNFEGKPEYYEVSCTSHMRLVSSLMATPGMHHAGDEILTGNLCSRKSMLYNDFDMYKKGTTNFYIRPMLMKPKL